MGCFCPFNQIALSEDRPQLTQIYLKSNQPPAESCSQQRQCLTSSESTVWGALPRKEAAKRDSGVHYSQWEERSLQGSCKQGPGRANTAGLSSQREEGSLGDSWNEIPKHHLHPTEWKPSKPLVSHLFNKSSSVEMTLVRNQRVVPNCLGGITVLSGLT